MPTRPAPFELDNPDLSRIIDERALTSGDYPYTEKMKNAIYKEELYRLQIELAKLQRHVVREGERIVIIFEGRDAAGKGGAIKRFMEYLNPRTARAVALPKPTEAEHGQWYFQRYIQHLPTKGAMTLFDRSWYNRAGVEPVMGFCTPEQTDRFLHEVPKFEQMIQREGIRLFKFWLTIGQEMQMKRFHARRHDPLKHWKLSPVDLKAIEMWDDYTRAIERMFQFSHEMDTPWTVIKANDKRRARLALIRSVLRELEYCEKDETAVGEPDRKITGNSPDFLYSA